MRRSTAHRRFRFHRRSLVALTLVAAAALLGSLVTATAAVTGARSQFKLCPVTFTNPDVQASGLICAHSETAGGSIKLGNSKVPIAANPDTVDLGAYRPLSQTASPDQLAIVTPTSGDVFGGPAQTVPGGLLGLMCPSSIPVVSAICAEVTANPSLGGVTASLQLAAPATPGTVLDPTSNTYWFDPLASLGIDKLAVLRVPVKVQLNNTLLGSSCYIGSDTDPIVLSLKRLRSPHETITGHDQGKVIVVAGVRIGDSTFAVPGSNGCGPLGLADTAINLKVGLPSASGTNSAVINSNAEVALVCWVQRNC